MSAEYTPTTDVVRAEYWEHGAYRYGKARGDEFQAEFDRWLAGEIRKAKAEALRDAAEEWASDPEPVGDTSADYRNWLRDRADRIEATR